MQRIRVRPDDLESLSGSLRRSVQELGAMTQRTSSRLYGLAWEVAERAQAEARMDAIRHQSTLLQRDLERMAEFLTTRAQLFLAADAKGLDRALVGRSSRPGRIHTIPPEWEEAAGQAAPAISSGPWAVEQFPELFTGPHQAQYDGTKPADGTTTLNAAHPVTPALTGAGPRSGALYDDVINQFAVDANPRYAVRDSNGDGHLDTFCNIFVWDVTRAMGAEIPHWVNQAGAPGGPGMEGYRELNANGVCQWLEQHGTQYGWREVSAEEAQRLANQGQPAVAAWDSRSSRAGHVAMVRPGEYNPATGPVIAQAGGTNFNRGTVAGGFGADKQAEIKYYVHA